MRNIALIIASFVLLAGCSDFGLTYLGCHDYGITYQAQVEADLPDNFQEGQTENLVFFLKFANLSQADYVYPCLRIDLIDIRTGEAVEDLNLWLEFFQDDPEIDFTVPGIAEYEFQTRFIAHQSGAYDLILYTDQEPTSFRILIPPETP